MLVSNNVYKNRYVYDGAQFNFPISFPFLDEKHIQVRYAKRGQEDTDSHIMNPSYYMITGAGNPAGGVLTRLSNWEPGIVIVIIRDVPITQLHQYTQYDNFPAESHEDALAKLTMICQELDEICSRAITVPATSKKTPQEWWKAIYDEIMHARDQVLAGLTLAGNVTGATMVVADGTTTPRSISDRFADIINVKDFGAKGDGITDDTEAIQAALDSGKTVFIPCGVYVISDELEIVTQGQRILGSGMGYGYESMFFAETVDASGAITATNPHTLISDWKDCTTILVTGTGTKKVRTRYTYRGSAVDPEDPAMSVGINIQNDGVRIENLAVRLRVDIPTDRYNDSPDNYGDDWDVGIFVGSRGGFSMRNVAVLGYFRMADIWIDSTQASNMPRFSGRKGLFPEGIVQNGVDYLNFERVITSGGLWGVRLQGVKLAEGHESRDVPYYDSLSGKTMPDYRGSFGSSDICFIMCQIFGANHHTFCRMVDMPSDKIPDVSVGGAYYIDGYAPNTNNAVHGHRYISCRFQSTGPTAVFLNRTSRDLFLGCMIENPTGYERTHSGEVISEVSTDTTFGGLYMSEKHNKLRLIGSYAPFFYAYSTISYDDFIIGQDRFNDQYTYINSSERVYLAHGLSDGLVARAMLLHGNGAAYSMIAMGETEDPYKGAIHFLDNDSPTFKFSSSKANYPFDKTEDGVYRKRILEIVGNYKTNLNTFISPASTQFITNGSFKILGSETGDKELLTLAKGGSAIIDGPIYAKTDNTKSCGQPEYRWTNVYAASGSINTSDEREKQDVTEYPDEVLDAWGEVELRQFLFKDAVAKKGEAARIHAGVIAQQVMEAFEKHGLDATRYGLLCYDKWEDEYEDVEVEDGPPVLDADGNEVTPAKTHTERRLVTAAGDRYGIRYSEALCIEAAYQRRCAYRLEARTEILEKRVEELRALIAECSGK